MTTRFRLDIAYEGTGFKGWAAQPQLPTVEGLLEQALATVFRGSQAPKLVVAGRTDAGVHATGQVAHFDIDEEQLGALGRLRGDDPCAALTTRLNGLLGSDKGVTVIKIIRVPASFDARFSAVWRRYQYRIADLNSFWDPLQRHRTVRHPRALDLASMDAAAASLVGLHDFAAFCKPRAGATTIRTLQRFNWQRATSDVLLAEVQADAFCHSMVRALVGACVAVGEGRLVLSDLEKILAAGERTGAFKVMPAKGLTLIEVGYPAFDELAARAKQTRARRKTPGNQIALQ